MSDLATNLANASTEDLLKRRGELAYGLQMSALEGVAVDEETAAEAARLVLGGPFTAVFWVGVVFMGILLPLVIQSLAVTHRIIHTPIAPILVMLGGLALRFVIVAAGQHSHWSRLL